MRERPTSSQKLEATPMPCVDLEQYKQALNLCQVDPQS